MYQPLISVVIPTYNAGGYIGDAIRSVLRQQYTPIEIIVVDDGSTDNTPEVLRTFGDAVIVLNQENSGQSVARNRGLHSAQGDIIGLLDADDMWSDDHVSVMLPFLVDDQYDFVRGMTQYIKDVGTIHETKSEPLYMEALVGACLYKRSLFETAGYFDEEMRQGEDFDWSIRIRESGCREKQIDDTTLWYRRHEDNLTNNQEVVKQGQIQAFRKKIAREKERRGSIIE